MASSCDVYRNYEGLHRKAEVAPILGLIGEGSPLRATRYPYRADPRRPADAPDAWMDDYDKIPLEAALRARPSLERRHSAAADGVRTGRWTAALPLAGAAVARGVAQLKVDPDWLAWRATYGYVADVADAIACAALDRRAIGRVFNLGAPGGRSRRLAPPLRRGDRLARRGRPDAPRSGKPARRAGPAFSLAVDTGRLPPSLRLERTHAHGRGAGADDGGRNRERLTRPRPGPPPPAIGRQRVLLTIF